eukprot:718095-Alexandrium_andersonii.AAC.1
MAAGHVRARRFSSQVTLVRYAGVSHANLSRIWRRLHDWSSLFRDFATSQSLDRGRVPRKIPSLSNQHH